MRKGDINIRRDEHGNWSALYFNGTNWETLVRDIASLPRVLLLSLEWSKYQEGRSA